LTMVKVLLVVGQSRPGRRGKAEGRGCKYKSARSLVEVCACAGSVRASKRAQQVAERRRVRLLGWRGWLRSCAVVAAGQQQRFHYLQVPPRLASRGEQRRARQTVHIHAAARMRRSARFASPPPFSLPLALEGPPDLQVRVAPVVVAAARRVVPAAVRAALLGAGAAGAGRTVVPDLEVHTIAKMLPPGWADRLVLGATLGDGFVVLGLARAQSVEVVAAGGTVVADVGAAAAVIPMDSAAPFLGPTPLRLGTYTAHTSGVSAALTHGRTSAAHESSIVIRGVLMKQPPRHLSK
jgi:hypothetical protein